MRALFLRLRPSIPPSERLCNEVVGGADLDAPLNTYLSLRHDIKVAAVQGEGHVSEDRAAVLYDRYRLVLGAAVRRSVHTDLQRKSRTPSRSAGAIYIRAMATVGKKEQAKSD